MSTLTNGKETLILPAGQVLSIASPSGSTGLAVRLSRLPGGGNAQSVTAIAGSALTFGAYAAAERFEITCTTGTLTLAIAVPAPSLSATDVELALKADIASMAPVILAITDKTPVNAVAATGKMVSSGSLAGDGSIVTIGTTVYTLKTTLSTTPDVPFEVLLGNATTNTAANLTAAINEAAGAGSTYATGTTAHPDVTAAASSDDIDLTADVSGVAGNAIVTTDDDAEITWSGPEVALVGGIDGTVGVEFEVCADSSYLYYATAENTIADANWRRVDIGSVY